MDKVYLVYCWEKWEYEILIGIYSDLKKAEKRKNEVEQMTHVFDVEIIIKKLNEDIEFDIDFDSIYC